MNEHTNVSVELFLLTLIAQGFLPASAFDDIVSQLKQHRSASPADPAPGHEYARTDVAPAVQKVVVEAIKTISANNNSKQFEYAAYQPSEKERQLRIVQQQLKNDVARLLELCDFTAEHIQE